MANLRLRQPLTLDEVQRVREWRNAPDVLPMLRTGYKSVADQAAFYRTVICHAHSPHRYYAVDLDHAECVGCAGLTYLDRTPGEAEISLLLDPAWRQIGVGGRVVDAVLEEAQRLGLRAVRGECYTASPALGFWLKQVLVRRPTLVACLDLSVSESRGSMVWVWTLESGT